MIDFIGLELIVFHDVPLKNMVVNFGSAPKLELEILLREEKNEDYVETKLIFGGLEHINPQVIPIEDYFDAEIYSFNYYLQGDLFFGKLTCLAGFGKASYEIDFSCWTVEIEESKNRTQ